MPDIDIAVHAAILIEEKFARNYDDIDDGSNAGPTREVTAENAAEEAAAREKIEQEEENLQVYLEYVKTNYKKEDIHSEVDTSHYKNEISTEDFVNIAEIENEIRLKHIIEIGNKPTFQNIQ